MSPRTLVTSLAVCVALEALARRPARAAEAGDAPAAPAPAWRLTLAIGTTVPVGKEPHLPPVPGFGARVLVERSWLGAVASADLMLAECVNGVEPDESCGSFSLWSVGPQATLLPRGSWSPYASLLFQIGHAERHAFGLPYHNVSEEVWVPAVGPRLGVRYRGRMMGFYLETGASFMRATSDRSCDFGCPRWWFWQTSTGLSVSFG